MVSPGDSEWGRRATEKMSRLERRLDALEEQPDQQPGPTVIVLLNNKWWTLQLAPGDDAAEFEKGLNRVFAGAGCANDRAQKRHP